MTYWLLLFLAHSCLAAQYTNLLDAYDAISRGEVLRLTFNYKYCTFTDPTYPREGQRGGMKVGSWEGQYPYYFGWSDAILTVTPQHPDQQVWNVVSVTAGPNGVTLDATYLDPKDYHSIGNGTIKCPFTSGGVVFYSDAVSVTQEQAVENKFLDYLDAKQDIKGGLEKFASFLTGRFDNRNQVVMTKTAQSQQVNLYQHYNAIIDEKISNRPTSDAGHFVLAEFYSTTADGKTSFLPFFFKIVPTSRTSSDCMLIGYKVPVANELMKIGNLDLTLDFNALQPDPKFMPTVYHWNAQLQEFHASTDQLEESITASKLVTLDRYGVKQTEQPAAPVYYDRLWV